MQKILKLAIVSRSYSKNKSGTFLWNTVSRVILFLYSSLVSDNTKNIQLLYSNIDFSHVKYFFWNILLKTV